MKTSSQIEPKNAAEAALLLACARPASDVAHAAEISRLARQPDLDWEVVLHQAEGHALQPLLYWHLQQSSPESVPPALLEELKARFHGNVHRNLMLTGELLRVWNLLRKEGILAIPYKGPVLAEALYGNLALRQFADLDIVVPPRQALAAKQVLLQAGYLPTFALTRRQEAALLRSNCEFSFENPERRSCVELHWRIAPAQFAIEFDVDGLWARSLPITLGGTPIRTLAGEDLLLVLSVHAAKHRWRALCWLCDIAALLRARPALDWEAVLAQAERLGALRILLISVELCAELLGSTLPSPVLAKIQADPEVAAVARAVTAALQTGTDAGDDSGLRAHRFLLHTRSRWRDKSRYAWRVLFTPGVSEWSLLALPVALTPLYPVIRLGRIAGRVLRRPSQRPTEGPAQTTPAPAPLDEPLPPARS